MNYRVVFVCLMLLLAGGYIHFVKPVEIPLNKPFFEFPVVVGDWRMAKEDRFSADVIKILKATDYLSRQYEDSHGNIVTLYLGYHGLGGVHSPKNCLPSAGWFLNSQRTIVVDTPDGGKVEVVESDMSKGEHSVLFFYWYQIRGLSVTNEYALKAAEIWNRLTSRRKDESFIRISTSSDMGSEHASPVLKRFVKDFYSVIMEHFPS